MKRKFYVAAICLVVTYAACTSNDSSKSTVENDTSVKATKEDKVKRGEYLVSVIGCGDCHTPKIMTPQGPAPDMERFLSGYNAEIPLGAYDTAIANSGRWVLMAGDLTAAAGPWGVSFASNLTPDGTGLGNWSYDAFRRAMREGKYKGLENSRPLLPPMPWFNFKNMTDDDLESIYEYLKTIKPVKNLVPQAIINMPPQQS
jgi:hypothetical protein